MRLATPDRYRLDVLISLISPRQRCFTEILAKVMRPRNAMKGT
jgi:hypothetical protein